MVLRCVEIVTSVLGFGGALWLDEARGQGESNAPLRAEQLRELLVRLGPSFIKAGQVLANRPDIVRADYMQTPTFWQQNGNANTSAWSSLPTKHGAGQCRGKEQESEPNLASRRRAAREGEKK